MLGGRGLLWEPCLLGLSLEILLSWHYEQQIGSNEIVVSVIYVSHLVFRGRISLVLLVLQTGGGLHLGTRIVFKKFFWELLFANP